MRRKPTHVDTEQTLDAARGVAFEHGLYGISVESIAATLEVPPKLVAKAEPSMQALVVRVFQSIVSGELADVKRVVLAHPQPVLQLRALLQYLGSAGDNVEVDTVWAEAWSMCRRNPLLAEVVRAEETAWLSFVGAVIARGVRSGDFLPADADDVAHTLLAVIDGVNMWTLAGYRSDVDRMRLLTSVAELQLGVTMGDRETTPAG